MDVRRTNPNENELLQDIIAHCRSEKIKLRFQPRRKLGTAKFGYSGYFDGSVIAVAHRNREWFKVFVHEYCHLLQKLDGDWIASRADEWAPYTFDQWIEGKSRPTKARLLECTRAIQRCELDCERRVIGLAEKYALPWDLDEYIRGANVYVLSYEASRRTRQAGKPKKAACSRVGELLELVPNRFIRRDSLGQLPEGFLSVWLRRCA